MYSTNAIVTFLGSKKNNFNDTEMVKCDFYVDGEVDSYYVQATNPVVAEINKLKPMTTCEIGISWVKRDKGWSHRLNSVNV